MKNEKKQKRRRSNFQDARKALDQVYALCITDPARRSDTVSAICYRNHLGATFGLALRQLKVIHGKGKRSVTWCKVDGPSDQLADQVWQLAKDLNRAPPANEEDTAASNVAQFPRQNSLGPGAQMPLGPLLPEEQVEADNFQEDIKALQELLDDVARRHLAFTLRVKARLGQL